MEGGKDPFNRRTYPWGKEDAELLAHFRLLGQLRRDHEALRLGSVEFFQAGEGRVGFVRRHGNKVLRIYCNQSNSWAIRPGKLLLARNLQLAAPDALTLGPGGFCITED